MPPANSPDLAIPSQSSLLSPSPHPSRTPSPSSFLHDNAPSLNSPVLDLASTLTVQAEDDMDQENVDFLRRRIESEDSIAETESRDVRSERRRMRQLESDLRERSWAQVLQGRESLAPQQQRTMADLRSLSEAEARERRLHQRRMAELRSAMDRRWNQVSTSAGTPAPPYTTSENSTNALYDWAPSHDEQDDERLISILSDLRQQQPNTHPDILNMLARTQLEADLEHARRNAQPSTQPHEQSLRSTAILQSVRRQRIHDPRQATTDRRHDLVQRYNAARSDLVRQFAADSQEHTTARQDDPQRADESLSLLDAMRLDVQGESSRNARYADTGNAQNSSTLRNLRLLPDARQVLDNAVAALVPRAPAAAAPLSSRMSGNASDHAWQHHWSRNRHRHIDPKDMNVEFKHAIEVSKRLHDSDVDDVEALFREYNCGPVSSTMTRDKLLELRRGQAVPPTSYLRAGLQFVGTQSSQQPTAVSLNSASPQDSTRGSRDTNAAGQPASRSSADGNSASACPSKETERWTVKVSIHQVDYDKMTLQGTMEAADVPNRTSFFYPTDPQASVTPSSGMDPSAPSNLSSRRKTTFSTFVDGEIIDLDMHALLTPSSRFAPADSPAHAARLGDFDAMYWRKLEPFASLTDEQLAGAILDPRWRREELQEKYILMRWKERCFIAPVAASTTALRAHPRPAATEDGTSATGEASSATTSSAANTTAASPASDAATSIGPSSGAARDPRLTISGFYYVSLRRRDGLCQGLYFDPHTNPYQYLELAPQWAGRSWAKASRGGGAAATAATDIGGGLWGLGSCEFR